MSTSNTELQSWVEEVSEMTKPDNIYWCNGSKEEYEESISTLNQIMQVNDKVSVKFSNTKN